MSLDDRTAQEKLTPEERRTHLRAFADRMLLKVSAMDDPEDMAGVEKAVRVVAVIERIYSRCDRAERHAPDPRKVEAERATHQRDAIRARVSLANTLKWGEQRRQDLGKWWDEAETASPEPTPATVLAASPHATNLITTAPADSEIGPVLDSLLDDLEALTDAIADRKPYVSSRVYPPAKTAPYACADDSTYAMTKSTYDNLRRLYALNPAGASP